jgi:outer membrane lipoprotein-sorting protein
VVRLTVLLVSGLALTYFTIGFDGSTQGLTGEQIMQQADERAIPSDMKSDMTMKLISKKGQERVRTVRIIRQGDEKQIMWFLAPPDVRGTSFLRISHDDRDDDMWLYLPAFKKVRRIASRARKENFMGSDFTYEDMEKRKLKDYTYKLLREELLGDHQCYVVESTPKEDVDTDYSKIVSWVWKDDHLLTKEEFYDSKAKLRKVKTMSGIEKHSEYWIPGGLKMENVQKQHVTDIIFDKIEVDTGVEDDLFSTAYLQRIR